MPFRQEDRRWTSLIPLCVRSREDTAQRLRIPAGRMGHRPDWELTVGARYDHYSDFAGSLAPRLALVWQTGDQLTTKLLYGQAFRAPYYQELYAETSFSRSPT